MESIERVKKARPGGMELVLKIDAQPQKQDSGVKLILLLCMGVYGIFYVLTSSFRLEYGRVAAFLYLLAYITMITAVFYLCKRKSIYMLAMLIVWAAAGLIFRERLFTGLQLAFNQCLTAVNGSQGSAFRLIAFEVPERPELYTTAALCYMMLPVVLMLSYAVLYRYNVFLVLLLALPILELDLYCRLMPELMPFGLLIAFVLASIAMHQVSDRPAMYRLLKYHDERSSDILNKNAGSVGLAAAFFFGFFLVAFGLLVPAKTYNDFVRHSTVLSQIDKVIDRDFWLRMLSGEKYGIHGGITGGRLGETGEYTFTGKTDLVVTADSLRNTIYLRGFVGADYTGSSWDELPGDFNYKYKNVVSQMGIEPWEVSCKVLGFNKALFSPIFQTERRKISIKNINAPGKYAYVPYNTIYSGNLKLGEDGTAIPKGDSYTLQYYDINNYSNNLFLYNCTSIKNTLLGNLGNGGGTLTPDDINACFESEKLYAGYVHQAYTRLPKDLPEEFVRDFANLNYTDVESLIKSVTGKLSAMATYTLSPGTLPKGENYVKYFLYKNKKGFCTDFATAATLIFRMSGIPARYVEGYVATIEDYTNAENIDGRYVLKMKDSNSHAWVELYLDGFGWVPVEVTPGFTVLPHEDKYASGRTAKYQVNAGQTTNKLNIENPVMAGEASEKETGKTDGFAGKTGYKSRDSGPGSVMLKCVYAAIALFFITIAAVFLRRSLILKKRKNDFETDDLNASALAAYEFVTDIVCFAGVNHSDFISEFEFSEAAECLEIAPKGEFTVAAETALKAAFSGQSVTAEEREILVKLACEVARRTYSGGSLMNKLKFRYIFIYI